MICEKLFITYHIIRIVELWTDLCFTAIIPVIVGVHVTLFAFAKTALNITCKKFYIIIFPSLNLCNSWWPTLSWTCTFKWPILVFMMKWIGASETSPISRSTDTKSCISTWDSSSYQLEAQTNLEFTLYLSCISYDLRKILFWSLYLEQNHRVPLVWLKHISIDFKLIQIERSNNIWINFK